MFLELPLIVGEYKQNDDFFSWLDNLRQIFPTDNQPK